MSPVLTAFINPTSRSKCRVSSLDTKFGYTSKSCFDIDTDKLLKTTLLLLLVAIVAVVGVGVDVVVVVDSEGGGDEDSAAVMVRWGIMSI